MNKLEEHFVMVLSAPRKSGKSHLVKNMLKSGLLDKYDHVVIMCPTLEFNDDYEHLRNHEKVKLIHSVSASVVRELIDRQESCMRDVQAIKRGLKQPFKITLDIEDVTEEAEIEVECPSTLLILDDCIDSGVIRFGGVVDRLAERGRHFKMSTIICAQRHSAISRSIRLNADYYIIFSPYSIAEMEKYLEEFVSRDVRRNLRNTLNKIFEIPYHFVLLDNSERNPKKRLKVSNADDFIEGRIEPIELVSQEKPVYNEPKRKRRRVITEEVYPIDL